MRGQSMSWHSRGMEGFAVTEPTTPETDELEATVQAAINACDGDLRATIRALVIANAFLEDELAQAVPAVSYGYSKGRHARRRAGE